MIVHVAEGESLVPAISFFEPSAEVVAWGRERVKCKPAEAVERREVEEERSPAGGIERRLFRFGRVGERMRAPQALSLAGALRFAGGGNLRERVDGFQVRQVVSLVDG